MKKEFMKLLLEYINKMQELWQAGDCVRIQSLATAIVDMTKDEDTLDIIAGCDSNHMSNYKKVFAETAKEIMENQ